MIGFEPISVQNGGTACVLSGLLHHSAWCRTSNWPMRTVDLCNGLVSGSPSGRGCPVNAAQERSGGAELPVLARAAVPHRQVFTERARGRRLGSGTCGVARASLEGHLL